MSFNTFRENKILAKISEFTVIKPMHMNFVFIVNLSEQSSSAQTPAHVARIHKVWI